MFFLVFHDGFNKYCYNFDDLAKMATLGLLKKVFWNKGYDIITFADDTKFYHVPQIIL